MVRQKKAPAARRRPMSREEALARQERQQRRRELEQESRELAKGPIDLPFFILVMLLTGVGLVMLLSASFPSAYYETDGQNPMSYFIRQGVFAIMGVAAMLFIGKINYQRFRGLAKPLLYLAVILLILVNISLRRRFKENIGACWHRRYNLGCKAHTRCGYIRRRRDNTAAHSA